MEESPKLRPSRLRRILNFLGASAAALSILVVFAPAFLSTDWGKGFLESRLSKSLGMPVTMGECSLGWRSSTQIRDLRVGPSEQGLQASLASLQANFSVWDWVTDGEELLVEIERPEILVKLPASPKPELTQAAPVAAPAVTSPAPPPPEEKPTPFPFRKMKLTLREGSLRLLAASGAETAAQFEVDATLLAEMLETDLQLRWTHSLDGVAALLPAEFAPETLSGSAKGSLSLSMNRAGGRVEGKCVLRDLRVTSPKLAAPIEESQLEISLGEGQWNLLLGEGEIEKFALRAQSQQIEVSGKAKASDRFKEWKLDASVRLSLERLAPWLGSLLPAGIPLEGPLEARVEARFPRRHPDRARATLRASGKIEGKSWEILGEYDGQEGEPQIALRGQTQPISVRPGFLSTLAYPIPLLAAKESHLLRLESAAAVQFQLQAQGRDVASWKRTVRGEGKVSLPVGGTLSGPSALAKIFAKASEGGFRFEGLEAPFRIENEKLTSPGMLLEAAGAKIFLIGSTGFDGALDYTVRVELPQKLKEKGLGDSLESLFGKQGLPAALLGSVSDPKFEFSIPEAKDLGKALLEEGLEAWKKKRKKD